LWPFIDYTESVLEVLLDRGVKLEWDEFGWEELHRAINIRRTQDNHAFDDFDLRNVLWLEEDDANRKRKLPIVRCGSERFPRIFVPRAFVQKNPPSRKDQTQGQTTSEPQTKDPPTYGYWWPTRTARKSFSSLLQLSSDGSRFATILERISPVLSLSLSLSFHRATL
jgi:hypothetical protein